MFTDSLHCKILSEKEKKKKRKKVSEVGCFMGFDHSARLPVERLTLRHGMKLGSL
jgi:hypothetical protein